MRQRIIALAGAAAAAWGAYQFGCADAVVDGTGGGTSTPPPPPGATVLCGSAGECALPEQICCVTQQGTATVSHCSTDQACPPDVVVRCNEPEDCPTGQQCCGTFDMTAMRYRAVGCRSACAGTEPQPILCTHDGHCPAPLVCARSEFLPEGYARCIDPADL